MWGYRWAAQFASKWTAVWKPNPPPGFSITRNQKWNKEIACCEIGVIGAGPISQFAHFELWPPRTRDFQYETIAHLGQLGGRLAHKNVGDSFSRVRPTRIWIEC